VGPVRAPTGERVPRPAVPRLLVDRHEVRDQDGARDDESLGGERRQPSQQGRARRGRRVPLGNEILLGEVRVTDPQGRVQWLVPGSVAYFPTDTWWEWHLPQHVRKLSFNRRSVLRPAGLLSRGLGVLLRETVPSEAEGQVASCALAADVEGLAVLEKGCVPIGDGEVDQHFCRCL